MRVVNPGRVYELAAGNGLNFLLKEDGQVVRDGTTIEEVLEVLIDRVTEAYQALPCQETIRALYLMREALAALETRTARRILANVEGTRLPHDPVPEAADALPGRTIRSEVEDIRSGAELALSGRRHRAFSCCRPLPAELAARNDRFLRGSASCRVRRINGTDCR